MNAPDLNHGPARLYWVIWLGLFAGLAVLVTAAFLLNDRFGSRIGTQGRIVVAAAPSAAPAVPVPLATSVSIAVPISPASAAASAAPGASGASSPLVQEVAAAYQRYWDVYSDALLNLNTSQIAQVASGDELRRIQDEVDGVRKQHEAVRVVVEHHYFVFDATTTQPKVYDEIQNRSFTVDPVTKQGTGSDASDLEKDTYFFDRVDGTWKVARSSRQRASGS